MGKVDCPEYGKIGCRCHKKYQSRIIGKAMKASEAAKNVNDFYSGKNIEKLLANLFLRIKSRSLYYDPRDPYENQSYYLISW